MIQLCGLPVAADRIQTQRNGKRRQQNMAAIAIRSDQTNYRKRPKSELRTPR